VSHAEAHDFAPPVPQTRRRVVLLGASNLTKSIGVVLSTARQAFGPGLDVLAAWGHGRSYGRASRVLGRQLPGILECGIWRQLSVAPRADTAALVTDIGNDLLYEEPVERICRWVDTCFDRLAAQQAQTVVTLLPIANLEKISDRRYKFFRTIFFPRSRIRLDEMSRRASVLNAHVEQSASARGFTVVAHRDAWYGIDPIHIRFAKREQAWNEILSPWSAVDTEHRAARRAAGRTWYLRSRTPEFQRFLGFERRGVQPAARLGDGTTVAIY
jgi:hypothetical protein